MVCLGLQGLGTLSLGRCCIQSRGSGQAGQLPFLHSSSAAHNALQLGHTVISNLFETGGKTKQSTKPPMRPRAGQPAGPQKRDTTRVATELLQCVLEQLRLGKKQEMTSCRATAPTADRPERVSVAAGKERTRLRCVRSSHNLCQVPKGNQKQGTKGERRRAKDRDKERAQERGGTLTTWVYLGDAPNLHTVHQQRAGQSQRITSQGRKKER